MPYLLGLLLIVGSTTSAMAERGALWLTQEFPGRAVGMLQAAAGAPNILYGITRRYNGSSSWETLIRSQDGGQSWEMLEYVGERLWITALAVDASEPDTVYTAFQSGLEHGLLISRDGGEHWQKVLMPDHRPPDRLTPRITTIVTSPGDPGTAYLGTLGAGVYRSEDGGRSWESITSPNASQPDHVRELLVAPDDPRTVYASTGDMLYVSLDRGDIWQEVRRFENARFALSPIRTNTLYAADARGYSHSIMLRSRDAGQTWEIMNGSGPAHPQRLIAMPEGQLFLLNSDGIWETLDDGQQWRLLPVSYPEYYRWSRQQGFAFSEADPETLYLSGPGGVHSSDDGGRSWTLHTDGLKGVPAYLAQSPIAPRRWYAVTVNGVYRSDSGGLDWEQVSADPPLKVLPTSLIVHPDQPDSLFQTHAGRILRSLDGGSTWQALDTAPALDHLVAGAPGSNAIYAHDRYQRLTRSTDLGETWIELTPPSRLIQLLPISADGQRLFALAGPRDGPTLWSSLDDGYSWIQQPAVDSTFEDDEHAPNDWFRQIALSLQMPETVYQLTRGQLYRSDDGARHWGKLDQVPSRLSRIAVDPLDAETIYGLEKWQRIHDDDGRFVHSRRDLHRSLDGGRSWIRLASATSLEKYPENSELVVDPHTRAITALSRRSGFSELLLEDYPLVWWDPARPGQGLSLQADGDAIWGSWTHYDDSGRARWLLLSGTLRNNVLETELHAYRGPAPGGDWDPARVVSRPVGSVRIDFSQPFGPRFDYDLPEAGGTLNLEPFRPQADGPLSGIWWDPRQAGQGVTLSQQDGRLWGYWYHYDTSGESAWLLFQGELLDHELGTTLYRYRGPMLSDWNPDRLNSEPVGRVMLMRSGNEELRFDYRLDAGAQGSLTLQPF